MKTNQSMKIREMEKSHKNVQLGKTVVLLLTHTTGYLLVELTLHWEQMKPICHIYVKL